MEDMAYCTRDDMELQYGADNIRKWADLNNQEVDAEIEARIAWAIEAGDDEVDDRLRGGPYTIPFTTVPSRITRLSAMWAGISLYDSRGFTDADDAEDQLKGHRERFDREIRQIHAGQLKFDLETTDYEYPQVVLDEEES